jgi:hypothetical protein
VPGTAHEEPDWAHAEMADTGRHAECLDLMVFEQTSPQTTRHPMVTAVAAIPSNRLAADSPSLWATPAQQARLLR